MWNLFRKTKPETVQMTDSEKAIIYRFAMGEENMRLMATDIHRRYIPTLGVRGTIEQNFMAEVDNPVPDILLRKAYRAALIQYTNARLELY